MSCNVLHKFGKGAVRKKVSDAYMFVLFFFGCYFVVSFWVILELCLYSSFRVRLLFSCLWRFFCGFRVNCGWSPPQTNMTIEHPPFEDVFPTEIGIFEHHVRFEGSTLCLIEYGRSNPAVQVIYLYIRGLLFYWSRRCESLAQVPLFCRPR